MDFLDPQKKRRNHIQMAVGYVLVSILILLATTILLYQAYGYGVDKNGQIIQNGLVFVSSAPNPSNIYLNGVLNKAKTNTRLNLPAGQYTLKITHEGYRDWQRSLGVEGGSVERFDYPFLFPTTPVPATIKTYTAQPGISMQSPDRHWLIIGQSPTANAFDMWDLNNRKAPPTEITVPLNALGAVIATQSWQLVEWSNDNRHVLLQRQFQGGNEYILLDTQTPANSVNLTKTLNLPVAAKVSLLNKLYNQYFIYDTATLALGTETLSAPTVVPMLSRVLAFKTYGTNDVLYATDSGVASGKTIIRMQQGSKDVPVRTVVSGSQYLLNLTQYNGAWYVAAGAASEDRVFMYKDPVGELNSNPDEPLVPIDIMKVTQPNSLEFSATARYIAVESGQAFAVYDVFNDKTYNYQLTIPVDAGSHATWMDGDRLLMVSNNSVVVLDYDDANQQTLNPAVQGTVPFFDRDYKYLYDLAPSTAPGQQNVTRTPMTVPPVP